MIHPRIDELLEHVDSRYALVIVAAKRARQINNYHHQLGEGTFDDFAPPLVGVALEESTLTMALEEIAEGKIVKYAYPDQALSHLAGSNSRAWLAFSSGVTGGIARLQGVRAARGCSSRPVTRSSRSLTRGASGS